MSLHPVRSFLANVFRVAFTCLMALITLQSRAADDALMSQLDVPAELRKSGTPNAYRVLFIGDSITKHGTNANFVQRLGWRHEAGMAASEEAKDYASLVAGELQSVMSCCQVESYFHRLGGSGSVAQRLSAIGPAKAVEPHLVIVQLGEHEKEPDGLDQLKTDYAALLTAFVDQPQPPRVIAVGPWAPRNEDGTTRYAGWPGRVEETMQAVCDRLGVTYVSIRDVAENPANSGWGGHPGVRWHPNDAGHAGYAEKIMAAYRAIVAKETSLFAASTSHFVPSAVHSSNESMNSSTASMTTPPDIGGVDVIWQDRFDTAPIGQLAKLSGDDLFAPTGRATTDATYANVSIVDDGEGGKMLRHNIPAGELGLFYVPALLSRQTDHAVFEYDIRFDSEFDWRWGGKIPGLVGVRPGESWLAPSSGNADREKGFSTRLMWHGNDDNVTRPFRSSLPPIPAGSNDMVTYIYARHPREGFDNFGWQTGLGALSKGVWHRIKFEVKMNTPSQRNGIFRVWIDGALKYSATDWDYRAFSDIRIQAIFWDIHRGGDVTPGWVSSRACRVDIRNVIVRDMMSP